MVVMRPLSPRPISSIFCLHVLHHQIGQDPSHSISRNAASYFPRPRLRSQTTTSMMAPDAVLALARGEMFPQVLIPILEPSAKPEMPRSGL